MRADLARRGPTDELDRLLAVDGECRSARAAVEEARAARTRMSKQIGQIRREGGESAELEAQVRELGERLQRDEERLRELEAQRDRYLLALPNLTHPEAPDGGEDDAVELRRVGTEPRFDFPVRDHVEIGRILGGLDLERAARTSGARFAYLLGPFVRLQLALVNFAVQVLGEEGFTPVVPPVLVREEAMWGTGFFPTDRSSIYRTADDDLFLVGTSEVPLAAFHQDEILDAGELPLRYAGISTCFRREAGAAGRDTRGMFRVHQFDKVEMFSFARPDQSSAEHEMLVRVQERMLQALELHYRVVDIAVGDLGASAARKLDCEAFMPGQGRFREVTSCSNCTDYQARRLRCRIASDGGTEVAHTLNGTAVAVGRTLIALVETHQREDGSVAVPEALQAHGAPALLLPTPRR